MAISSIRQAMTALIQANKSLLAQELRLTLQKHIHSTTASVLYPSWLKLGTSPPHGSSVPGLEGHALKMAIHHLCDACTNFALAGMDVAARSCVEFSARVMAEQPPLCEPESADVDDTHMSIDDSKESGVDSWWGM